MGLMAHVLEEMFLGGRKSRTIAPGL